MNHCRAAYVLIGDKEVREWMSEFHNHDFALAPMIRIEGNERALFLSDISNKKTLKDFPHKITRIGMDAYVEGSDVELESFWIDGTNMTDDEIKEQFADGIKKLECQQTFYWERDNYGHFFVYDFEDLIIATVTDQMDDKFVFECKFEELKAKEKQTISDIILINEAEPEQKLVETQFDSDTAYPKYIKLESGRFIRIVEFFPDWTY